MDFNNLSEEARHLVAAILVFVIVAIPIGSNWMAKRHRPMKTYKYTTLDYSRKPLSRLEKVLAHLRII